MPHPSTRRPLSISQKILTENLNEASTLLDSGSTGCFIDNRLPLENLKKSLRLTLFDGSVASHPVHNSRHLVSVRYSTPSPVPLDSVDQSVTVTLDDHTRHENRRTCPKTSEED